jgi:PAS domain S-box-containing protein
MQELQFEKNKFLVSKTDTKGNITYGNELFLKLAGYSEAELLGTPHNIIRHPEMPKIVFKLLWETIQLGNEVNAYVINKSKNGDFYWVFANVTPSYDNNGNIIGYHSVRRKPSQKAIDIVKPLYKQLLLAQNNGGIQASEKIFNDLLAENGGRYDKFVLSI